LTIATAASAYERYRVVSLGFRPEGINNSGVVVGMRAAPVERAVIRQTDGTIVPVALPAGETRSWGFAIADNGAVSGGLGEIQINGAFYTIGSTSYAIGSWPGENRGFGESVNSSGQVVGWSIDNDNLSHATAFLWTPSGGKIAIAGPTQHTKHSRALDINEAGLVIGDVSFTQGPPPGPSGGFLWDSSGGLRFIANYNGRVPLPRSLNNSGYLTGELSAGSSEAAKAFLWKEGEAVQQLPELAGRNNYSATEINNNGVVAGDMGVFTSGSSTIANREAFIWSNTGGYGVINELIDPQSAGWTVREVMGINDSNWLVGMGRFQGGNLVGVLLQPVPEPASICVVGAGLIALTRRRRCL
jgi:hypothetical protein